MILGTKNSRNNSHCSLNLRMDGANDGTSFPDSSLFGHTMTRTNALTKTAVKKFGTASGYFNGSSRLVHATAAELNMGLKDFTIEYWAYYSSHTGFVYAKGDAVSDGTVQCYNRTTDQYLQFYLRQASPAVVQTINASVPVNAGDSSWHHIAFVRDGVNISVFIDGLLIGQDAETPIDVDNAGQLNIGVRIHSGSYALYFTGYLDSVMLIKNVARYKRNFKVPNRAA